MYMLFSIILLLACATIVADYACWRRRMRHAAPVPRRLFLLWTLIGDSLLPAIALTGLLLRDNTTTFMLWALWMLWIWMVVSLPRMVWYLFAAMRLPRAGCVVGIGLVGVLVWGATEGRTRLRVTRTEICSPRLPAAFDGLRIVQLSDIHLGTLVRPERELRRIVDSVSALRPDLILFTGDLVNIRSSELDDRAMRLLGGLRAPLGVWSVLGNHDVGVYIKDTVALPREESLARVVARQEAMGWRVLADTTVYLVRGGDSLSLSGLSFDPALRNQRHDANLPQAPLDRVYRGVPASLYNITAVHLPQFWEQIVTAGYGDLTLSGHVHAMQAKLRLFGRSFSPAQLLHANWSGRYDDGAHTLYVNDGTGCVGYPMRLGAWPEITLITLRTCE